jgi:hypothetical protein
MGNMQKEAVARAQGTGEETRNRIATNVLHLLAKKTLSSRNSNWNAETVKNEIEFLEKYSKENTLDPNEFVDEKCALEMLRILNGCKKAPGDKVEMASGAYIFNYESIVLGILGFVNSKGDVDETFKTIMGIFMRDMSDLLAENKGMEDKIYELTQKRQEAPKPDAAKKALFQDQMR